MRPILLCAVILPLFGQCHARSVAVQIRSWNTNNTFTPGELSLVDTGGANLELRESVFDLRLHYALLKGERKLYMGCTISVHKTSRKLQRPGIVHYKDHPQTDSAADVAVFEVVSLDPLVGGRY
jgi:hypothetical protein